jgi:hypothetical protein
MCGFVGAIIVYMINPQMMDHLKFKTSTFRMTAMKTMLTTTVLKLTGCSICGEILFYSQTQI